MTMHIKSSAPVRIDLAGGTLDIYPLYLFTDGGLTVNTAINLRVHVSLDERDDKTLSIRCSNTHDADYNISESLSIDAINVDGQLSLIKRLVRFYGPRRGLDIKVKTSAPPGAGLGGSSSLAMALGAGLNRLTGRNYSNNYLVDITCNIEAQELGVPAGRQDHYAALNGGFNAIEFSPLEPKAEKMDLSKSFVSELRKNTTLCYTGESRFSGNTNWDMFKRHVDGDQQTRAALAKIKDIAAEMKSALEREDYENVCSALKKEWDHRKRMAPGVSTPLMEDIIKASGAEAAKVCGAGGGGCLVLLGDIDREAVSKLGGKLLDFDFDSKGLEIR